MLVKNKTICVKPIMLAPIMFLNKLSWFIEKKTKVDLLPFSLFNVGMSSYNIA